MATVTADADNTTLNVIASTVVTLSDVATRVRLKLTATTFDAGTATVVSI